MKKQDMTDKYIKDNGVHYTPHELSFYMAKILVDEYLESNKNIDEKTIKVLDPACGDGELLVALAYTLKEKSINFEMYGIDTNNEELILAEERLKDIGIKLNSANIDYIDNYESYIDFDLIIANPPYVRTQNMLNDKRENNNGFAVNGRFDLYQLFFNAISHSLNYDGLLCIITSNKFMFNRAGEKTRQFLYNNYQISFVLDLGDSKLFEASVLPAIFLGKKQLFIEHFPIKAAKVYETKEIKNSNYSLFDALLNKENCIIEKDNHNYKLEFGEIIIKNEIDPWAINARNDMSFVDMVNKKKYCLLSNWASVKVGIKSTADKVFIRKTIEDFENCEKDFIHEMISSKNSAKWKCTNTKKYVLYPYIICNKKQEVIKLDDYPGIKKYIEKHSEILKKREYFKTSKKEWYEIWVAHSLIDFKKDKIVVPDISSEPKFMYDNLGMIVDGNCYWIVLKENIPKDYLFLILGLCNSKYMEKYHDSMFQNKLYSGKRRYVSQYINKYPMIDPDSIQAKRIIKLVKKILESNTEEIQIENIEKQIEKNISEYWEGEVNE